MKSKNLIIILSLSIFFIGCSVKMQTNHLPGGITEYNDLINGDKIIIKMKGRNCLPDAEIHQSYVIGKLKLSKNCKVISANYYTDTGEFIQKPDSYQLKQLQNSFADYMEKRERIEAINGTSTSSSFQPIMDKNDTNYDKNGFNNHGLHKDTGTEYNKQGLNRGGYTKKEVYQMTK
jgi:hypothetical protein